MCSVSIWSVIQLYNHNGLICYTNVIMYFADLIGCLSIPHIKCLSHIFPHSLSVLLPFFSFFLFIPLIYVITLRFSSWTARRINEKPICSADLYTWYNMTAYIQDDSGEMCHTSGERSLGSVTWILLKTLIFLFTETITEEMSKNRSCFTFRH